MVPDTGIRAVDRQVDAAEYKVRMSGMRLSGFAQTQHSLTQDLIVSVSLSSLSGWQWHHQWRIFRSLCREDGGQELRREKRRGGECVLHRCDKLRRY